MGNLQFNTTLASFSPELQFILTCINAYFAETNLPTTTAIHLLNWQCVLRIARLHRLSPLLYGVLKTSPLIPESALSKLRQHVTNNTHRVLALTAELHQVIQTFRQSNIPCIALKGPALAQMLYGSVAMREPQDLDILVPEQAVETAHALLLAQGYIRALPASNVAFIVKTWRRFNKDFGYYHPHKKHYLELHWRLFEKSAFTLPLDQLFKHPCFVMLNNQSIPILSPEHEFLYLNYHGATHSWARLHWLCDIKRYLQHHDFHWEDLFNKAKHIHAERALLSGILLCHQLLNSPLPPFIQQQASNDNRIASFLKTSYQLIARNNHYTLPLRLGMLKNRYRLNNSFSFRLSFYQRFFLRICGLVE